MSRRTTHRFTSAALTGCVIALCAPAISSAAEFVVNTTGDPAPGLCDASHCTLREAINAAGPADVVTVPPGTYQLAQGPLQVVSVRVNGAGARSTIIRGDGTNRVMDAATGQGNETPVVTGLTITNGGGGGASAGSGGGVRVSGALSLINVHVIGNQADRGGGVFVSNGGNLELVGSTVAGNTSTGSGGGIYADPETDVVVVNATISGNTTTDPSLGQGGGISANGYTLRLLNVTLANNTAAAGGGGVYLAGATPTFTNTILADNTGAACGGGTASAAASHHNLVTDGSCAMTGAGNIQGISAGLGGLANNGGPTDTRALAATSPAINAGSDCDPSDQRGIPRPQGSGCDIGAFEYVAPVLTVTTRVVNDDGGEDGPARFTVHVRNAAGAEVAGSPQPGSATGTSYALVPGSYAVSAEGPGMYAISLGGACAATGAVTVGENQSLTCTVVADDKPPVVGRLVNALPKGGTVRVKRPGSGWTLLLGAGQMPKGTKLDTRKGRVTLVAASDKKGHETKADFYDGIFTLRQSNQAKPTTTLTLSQKLTCPKAGTATTAAAKKKKKRRLWGDGSGRFRTKGRHSAATVVGTKWLVEDRCRATVTRVIRGRVSVRDFVKKKTVTVRRGKRYIARAERK